MTDGAKQERDRQGRFRKGNAAAAGRGPNRARRELARAMREELTPERLRTIVRSLLESAEEGDREAARLVLSYGVGRPREEDPEPIRLDLPRGDGMDLGKAALVRLFDLLSEGEITTREAAEAATVINAAALPHFEKGIEEAIERLRGERERHNGRDIAYTDGAVSLRHAMTLALPGGLPPEPTDGMEPALREQMWRQREAALRKVADAFAEWDTKRRKGGGTA